SACYDIGEGNHKWDLSPNVARWYDNDLIGRLAKLTPDQRDHVALWFDAGLRDFFNAQVSANAGVGQAMATGELAFGAYENFAALAGGGPEGTFDFANIKWSDWPKNGYLRYGNPDATTTEIMNGDGRHVGTG